MMGTFSLLNAFYDQYFLLLLFYISEHLCVLFTPLHFLTAVKVFFLYFERPGMALV